MAVRSVEYFCYFEAQFILSLAYVIELLRPKTPKTAAKNSLLTISVIRVRIRGWFVSSL